MALPDAGVESNRAGTRAVVAWVAVGLAGCVGLALIGTRLGAIPRGGHTKWWFSLPAGHDGLLRALFYLSIALVIGGWVGVGVQARRGHLSTKSACLILAVWSVPLLLGPPLFSRDIYSYVGQGLIAHRGLDPYSIGPSALGNGPVLESIASVWRHTPAPYGPLFITISRAVVAGLGGSLLAEVIVLRALELVGMALIAYSLPRLARRLGADPGIALWLGMLSPLSLFSFVASGHNDCLMVGLLLTGVTVAVEGRLKIGLVLCALGATIKVPAAAGLVFLAASNLRRVRGRERIGAVAEVVLIPVGTVAVVTLASGLGWKWLGPINFRVPSELRVLSTPTVSIGVFISRLLNLVHIRAGQAGTVTVVQSMAGAAGAIGLIWLVGRVRDTNVVRLLAIALFLVVLVGPTLWPWYLTWGLVLLAATSSQRSRALGVGAALAMLVVGPSGTPMLNGYAYIVVALACLGGCAWLLRQRRWSLVLAGRDV